MKIEKEDNSYIQTINQYKKTESIDARHRNKIKRKEDKTIYKLKEYPSTDEYIENHMFKTFDVSGALKDDLLDSQAAYCRYIIACANTSENIKLGDRMVSERWLIGTIMDGLKASQLAVEVVDRYDGVADYAETHATGVIKKKRMFVLKQIMLRIKNDAKHKELLNKLLSVREAIKEEAENTLFY